MKIMLYGTVHRHSTDTIIIDTDSPSRDTLEHLRLITESCPRRIIMFIQKAKKESIREAAVTATCIREALAGKCPVPAAITHQLRCAVRAADNSPAP